MKVFDSVAVEQRDGRAGAGLDKVLLMERVKELTPLRDKAEESAVHDQ